jgi:hypothetical protein
MNANATLRWASAAMACCALSLPARAEPDATSGGGLPTDRQAILAAYERMPPGRLEELFLHCDAQASREMLDAGDGILCAMAWDTLLKTRFGGDVQAFLAWWRPRRLAPPDPGVGSR